MVNLTIYTVSDNVGGSPGDSTDYMFLEKQGAIDKFNEIVKNALEVDLPTKKYDTYEESEEEDKIVILKDILGDKYDDNWREIEFSPEKYFYYDHNHTGWGVLSIVEHYMCPRCKASHNTCTCIEDMQDGDLVWIEDDPHVHRFVFKEECEEMKQCNGHTVADIKRMMESNPGAIRIMPREITKTDQDEV